MAHYHFLLRPRCIVSCFVVFIFLVPLARSQAQESSGASLPRRAGPMGVRIDPQITDRVTIHEVVTGSPAATVGLISGDTITSIAGKLVPTFETLRSTWREVYRSARPFELTWKLSFPTKQVGYCTIQSYDPDTSASARFIVKTTDGGKTWNDIPLVDDHRVREFGVAFLDENIGWVGALPHGFGTTDGGKSWSKVDFGNAVNKIRLIHSSEGVTGYAIGVEVHRVQIPTGD